MAWRTGRMSQLPMPAPSEGFTATTWPSVARVTSGRPSRSMSPTRTPSTAVPAARAARSAASSAAIRCSYVARRMWLM